MNVELTREELFLLLDLLGESRNWRDAKQWYSAAQLQQLDAMYERLLADVFCLEENP